MQFIEYHKSEKHQGSSLRCIILKAVNGINMSMNCIKSMRSFIITREAVRGMEKTSSKGGGTRDAPKAPTLSKADNFFSKEKSIKTPTIKNTL
ncbi:hypothetical protein PVL29_017592 [Vitis rotundifolia]|uniref:Uncharacterized protein n=1 Tax=Vitis rotundifolia TaxID=103349 RepID=A0AA38ZB59_VITRO|nr:hypothetical protein PVL29_017592 [Vitis rotundifolia]